MLPALYVEGENHIQAVLISLSKEMIISKTPSIQPPLGPVQMVRLAGCRIDKFCQTDENEQNVVLCQLSDDDP